MTDAGAKEHRKVVVGSERAFGIVFACVFAIIAGWPLLRGTAPRWWAVALAAAFLGAALVAPRALRPLNLLWFRFGILLHHVVNPVIMGLLFFVAIVPTAVVLKLRGKDLLRLKRDPSATSYWIVREPPGPAPGSMSKQF